MEMAYSLERCRYVHMNERYSRPTISPLCTVRVFLLLLERNSSNRNGEDCIDIAHKKHSSL
jgi:hypothetical protein